MKTYESEERRTICNILKYGKYWPKGKVQNRLFNLQRNKPRCIYTTIQININLSGAI